MLFAPGGAVFKGIPFAQPPAGNLRWREPQPVKSWAGVRDAGAYGPPCAQIAGGWNDLIASMGSEDCLYLNVWTAEWPSQSPKPVMFWIHGGGNMAGSALGGSGIEPIFDGENLARHGVVVVTANYRVGVLGFIGHPELTAESPHHASGNYGLLDQIAALHWIHDNIARFGGDPGKVTIFGQSAGAQDVGLLMASPLAKGLFIRAIAESGTVIMAGGVTPPLAQLENAGVILAGKMNAPSTGAIAYMRSRPAAEVLRASPPYRGAGPARPMPNMDGYALPQLPAKLYAAGEEAAVPLMIGNNGREQSFEGSDLRGAIETYYGSLASKAFTLYGLDGGQASTYPPYGDAGAQFRTDTSFRCAAVMVADWHRARNSVYEYEFTRGADPRHSGELAYVFGMPGNRGADVPDPKLSDQIEQYWTNFAKTGDPNGAGLPAWPKFDSGRRNYMELGADGPVVKSDLRGAACEPFREKVKQTMAQ